MERLVEPILADLRYEHERALARGQRWRGRRVRAAGYLGFWTAVVLHTAAAGPHAALSLAATNGWLIARIVAIAGGVFTGVTAVMILPPLLEMARTAPGAGGRLAMYFVPEAMFLAIPIALSAGIAYGCRGRWPSWRIVAPVLIVAICGTAAALATREWLIPEANQGFREAVAELHGIEIRGSRGSSELPLSELRARMDALAVRGSAVDAAKVSRIYQLHWALCFASLALGIFSLGASSLSTRRSVAVVVGLLVPIAYGSCLWMMDAAAQSGSHAAVTWLPNGLFLACGVVLLVMRRTSWRPEPLIG